MLLNRVILSSSASASCRRSLILSKSQPSLSAVNSSTSIHHPLHHRSTLKSNSNSNNTLQTIRWHGDGPGPDAPTVNITFVNPDDSRTPTIARVGETLLQTAHRTGIEMEGACEGVCACSTCHVILESKLYDQLLDDLEDGALGEDEEDMLDMAFGLSETSRLGCQVTVNEGMEGSVFTLPKATRNFYVDGHKPTPH